MTALTQSFDTTQFRQACSTFLTGVAVVTTALGEVKTAMTINSFSSVSLDPPLVLWSLRDAAWSRPIFEEAGRFAINILAADQLEIARQFARPGPYAPDGHAITASARGLPLLTDALANLECETRQILDGGDHRILIGEVIALSCRDGAPLAFYQGRMTASLPALERSGLS
jgi:flavin reductase (DIM6/NTAB) family NADH-FMN oxidoreductase RutF